MENNKKTIAEMIKQALTSDWDIDTYDINSLVAAAYYMGREDATKEVSDCYKAKIQEMRKTAQECRYHKMAESVINSAMGQSDYIYFDDYSQSVKNELGTIIWKQQ